MKAECMLAICDNQSELVCLSLNLPEFFRQINEDSGMLARLLLDRHVGASCLSLYTLLHLVKVEFTPGIRKGY